jgi:hypothetical protein
VNDTPGRDDEVLKLRLEGRTFARIAKSVGYSRSSEANDAFNRALRRKPSAEQADLRRHELARLDSLLEGVRRNAELAPEDRARRLRSVERLRSKLLAD